MKATVLGSGGFIGRHLTTHLRARGFSVHTPGRGEPLDPGGGDPKGDGLGHVFYCIGLTADFRTRPFDTFDAHVSILCDILRTSRFASLTYLSSTRVYAGAASTAEEAPLLVSPVLPDHLYNLSKLAGEAACLAHPSASARVVRLSNVYGDDVASENFLSAVLRGALRDNHVNVRSDPASAKDYVAVEDVVAWLANIALKGRHRIYNVACGENVASGALLEAIRAATGCTVHFAPGAPLLDYPPIDTSRLNSEFGAASRRLIDSIPVLVDVYRRKLCP